MNPINFQVAKTTGRLARAGVLTTPHGEILTPTLTAVGTKGTVKALTPEQLRAVGVQAVLANTYHLYLEPGDEQVAAAGGLHQFMNWAGPIYTDSGGFQVFSLGAAYGEGGVSKFAATGEQNAKTMAEEGVVKLARIDDDGVTFKSHLDGSEHRLTPEKSITIQHNLKADVIFAFDECTSPQADYRYQVEALERTHAWAKRSLAYHQASSQAEEQGLFGIIQGGRFEDLRRQSAETLGAMTGLAGFGIGGSFSKADLGTSIEIVNEILPQDKPRHLLGIGEPEDLLAGVAAGIDTFDCVAPTRMARNGTLYTRQGKINIFNNRYRSALRPIEEECDCYTCRHYTQAYLAHLFRSKEMLAATLASIHNLRFIVRLLEEIRQAILDNNFSTFQTAFLTDYCRH